MSRRLLALLVVVLLAVAAVAVRVATRDAGPCGDETTERLDPRTLQHVLPGAPEPRFDDAAPTSGPHQVGVLEGGVRAEPLPPALQVGALEAGVLLVQHRPEVAPDEVDRLRTLAGPRVLVAPNPAVDAPVVATAWRTRLRCDAVDPARLRRFAVDHTATAPGAHP